MYVLLVEDERRLSQLVRRVLEEEGHTADVAFDGEDGLHMAMEGSHDVIVLDVMLPEMDGIEVCKSLRANRIDTPVLLLTALDSVEDRVKGLDAGADDYLRKPFALAELRARIRALGRRSGQAPPARLTAGSVRIDFTARRLERQGREVPLTAREWAVLAALAAKSGRVVSRINLLEDVWHDTTPSSSESLDVILSRLRRKLGSIEDGCAIRTIRGAGFVFETTR